MPFADFWSDLPGHACLMFMFFLLLIGGVAGSIAEGAAKIFKSDEAKQVARAGFWMWLFDDDD
jgi:hypothetical protein